MGHIGISPFKSGIYPKRYGSYWNKSICELKFYKDKFSISEEYALEIEEKIEAFKKDTGTKKSIIPIMITSYGCVQNDFFKKLIAKDITLIDIMN